MEAYCVFFERHADAYSHMVTLNKEMLRNSKMDNCYCVIDGPEDNWAVVDFDTAIEFPGNYEWSYK